MICRRPPSWVAGAGAGVGVGVACGCSCGSLLSEGPSVGTEIEPKVGVGSSAVVGSGISVGVGDGVGKLGFLQQIVPSSQSN